MKWKLVPVEPTETMLDAASWHFNYQDMWRAMLDAAPSPPRKKKPIDEKAMRRIRAGDE